MTHTSDYVVATGKTLDGSQQIRLSCHEHEFVIGGDVLFKGSIGRTDLPGGDFKILISSIKNQLFSLPDAYIVYPGHGEYTTIGREKKSNIHFMNDNFLNRN